MLRLINTVPLPADEDLLVVEQHAVDLLDGVDGGLLSLEVDESIALKWNIFYNKNSVAEGNFN